MDLEGAAKAFREFVAVIQELRTPGTGCPWDLEQDHRTLRPYLIEEAYEVLDAIDRGADGAFREELGDLLLQIVLHAQVADDRGAFAITDVVRGITEKMVRRHPHVFGSLRVSGSAEVSRNWDQIKEAEAQGKGAQASHTASLERLPEGLPALLRAQRVGEKAAKVHLDVGSVAQAQEGLARLEREVQADGATPAEARARLEHELGEVLFALCQVARRLGLSAEECLRDCTRRFVDGFRRMEQQTPRPLNELSREEMVEEWRRAAEAGGAGGGP
jgi:MazG family protein